MGLHEGAGLIRYLPPPPAQTRVTFNVSEDKGSKDRPGHSLVPIGPEGKKTCTVEFEVRRGAAVTARIFYYRERLLGNHFLP